MSATDPNIPLYGPWEDLEEQQYEVLYHELDVPLQDLRKRYYRLFLIICTSILLLVLGAASIVKIPNYLQVDILIENTDKDQVMFFQHAAQVQEYLVEVGEEVEKGQKLCRVGAPQIKALISEIRDAEHNIRLLEKYDVENMKMKTSNLAGEKKAREERIRVFTEEVRASNAWFDEQKKALYADMKYRETLKEKDRKLFELKAISELEYLASERAYLDKVDELTLAERNHKQTLKKFEQRKVELEEMVLSLSHQIEEIGRNFDADKHKLEEQKEMARQKLRLFYGEFLIEGEELFLLAPNEGRVAYIYPDQQLLEAGEILYRLEKGNRTFEAKGMLPANRIGYVKEGLPAKIMLETFPHYEWGSLTGKVHKISSSPGEKGTYSISLEIPDQHPILSPQLQNGQTGTCSIIIERKSLFGYAFRKLKKSASEVIY